METITDTEFILQIPKIHDIKIVLYPQKKFGKKMVNGSLTELHAKKAS